MTAYAFGDSALARERLAIVAATFAGPTRALLAALPVVRAAYVLDLGCGPGHTTALLRERFPLAYVTGLDASESMLAEARERVPDAAFVAADVAAPLRLPADVVFARLLLGHLPEPGGALSHWARALRPGSGRLVCEEPVRYRVDDPWFERYEDAVTAVVRARGGTLWTGDVLDHDPPDCDREHDEVVEHTVPAARAAAMFWRNAVSWGDLHDDADALVQHFRAVEAERDDRPVIWEIRQAVWLKKRG